MRGKFPVELVPLVLGAAFQIYSRIKVFWLGYDPTFLIAQAVNFLNGKGFGFTVSTSRDLAHETLLPLGQWPPGLSVLFIIFHGFIRDYLKAVIAMDVVAIALFYAVIAGLLLAVRPTFGRKSIAVIGAIIGFAAPSYITFFTNVWSLAFLLGGILCLLPCEGRPASPFQCAAGGVLLALTVPMRWAYGPIALMPIAVTAALDFRTADGRRRIGAVLLGFAAVLVPMMIWKLTHRASPMQTLTVGRQYFPEHLLRMHPFASDAIFGSRLNDLFPYSHWYLKSQIVVRQFVIRHVLSVLVLIMAVVGAFESYVQAPNAEQKDAVRRLFLMGAACGVATVAMLAVISFFNPPLMLGSIERVYIDEPRYFVPALPFILFGVGFLACRQQCNAISRLLSSVAMIVVVAAATVTAVALPREWSAARRWSGQSGPLEKKFTDDGALVRFLRSRHVDGMPNVLVQQLPANNTTRYRETEAVYAGWSVASVQVGAGLYTSAPVNVVVITNGPRPANYQVKSDRIYEDLNLKVVNAAGLRTYCGVIKPENLP